jgi:hypothetical protein
LEKEGKSFYYRLMLKTPAIEPPLLLEEGWGEVQRLFIGFSLAPNIKSPL